MQSQGGVPASGAGGEGASSSSGPYGPYSQHGPYRQHGQDEQHSQPRSQHSQPHSQYAAGAPVSQPTSHLVEVRAGLKYTALQLAGPLLCLSIGGVAMVTAIQKPDVDNRWFAIIAGGVFVLLGLWLVVMLPRVLRTRRYTFTAAGLEGQSSSGSPFSLPWSAVASIAIQAHRHRSLGETLLARRFRSRTTAYLRISTYRGADRGGESTTLTMAIPFWNSPELIDSMAYGCRTFAGAKFQGVVLL